MGEVGQAPVQKVLKSGRAVTIFSVGTGGMHLNRRMFDGETPEEFAERSSIQWHRVAVYQEKVGHLILRSMKQGYVATKLPGRLSDSWEIDAEMFNLRRLLKFYFFSF